MIVKFHARGAGRGSGPVDYLLGRNRDRDGAELLRGDADLLRAELELAPVAHRAPLRVAERLLLELLAEALGDAPLTWLHVGAEHVNVNGAVVDRGDVAVAIRKRRSFGLLDEV